jgi:thymidylate kinase
MKGIKVGIVGPCAAGKTTLIAGLKANDYSLEHIAWAKHIAQEHSYVPDMWKRLTNPDILIFLDVSYLVSKKRRALDWSQKEFEEQLHRLRHARQNADFYINTDDLKPQEVLEQVLGFIVSVAGESL